MKYLLKMKRMKTIGAFFTLLCMLPLSKLMSQNITFTTADTEINLSDAGCYSSIKILGQDILQLGQFPVITAGVKGELISPKRVKLAKDILHFQMEDGGAIALRVVQSEVCITFEVLEIAENYDFITYGPLGVSINEVVGDIIGVAQGKGLSFGMQSLNPKTIPGIPTEYREVIQDQYGYVGESADLSVESVPYYRLAAVKSENSCYFQLSCRKRTHTEYRQVHQIKNSLVLPVKGEEALITGSKIALFGTMQAHVLERIGQIELEQGLPHPLIEGEWAKISRKSMNSYLITNFTEENFDYVVDKASKAGFSLIYHEGPFSDWGHFKWDSKVSKLGDEGVKKMVDRAKSKGIDVGVHTLSNFTTTNDAYVTPTPSKNLLKQGVLTLLEDIDATQTEIRIKESELFEMPLTLNGLHIDDELITFGEVRKEQNDYVLTNCIRGVFGTKATAHPSKSPLYKLWDYPYKTFFPDLELQDTYADRLAEIVNKTGINMISFDGLEGCMYTGHDEYSTARFINRFYTKLNKEVLNDASRLAHYMWHIHTRMNWGEPWGEAMRKGQVENRIKNQAFFHRNLLPRMLGWFLIRLAERNFECSSLEDLEWALATAAGFDAGYAMTIRTRTLEQHGQIDTLLEAIKNWDRLRFLEAFTEEQKMRLRDPETEWHLEKITDTNYTLYPLSISKHYRCNLSEMQPGQPGGADWSWETPYGGSYAIRLQVQGDGTISDPSFSTPKGVIKFPCEISSSQYLLYTFDGKAQLTDKNYRVIKEIIPQGKAELNQGQSAVAFSCNIESEDLPEVIVRHITKGSGEAIILESAANL
ncbi:MAG: hypothetical protein ACRC3Z_04090 [Phocaeicola sp.]